jgi:hypothetical protein
LHNMFLPEFAPFFFNDLNSSHCQQEDFNFSDKGTWWWTKKQGKINQHKLKEKQITIIPGIVLKFLQGRPYDRFFEPMKNYAKSPI